MYTKTNLYEKNGHVFYNVTSCKGEKLLHILNYFLYLINCDF